MLRTTAKIMLKGCEALSGSKLALFRRCSLTDCDQTLLSTVLIIRFKHTKLAKIKQIV